jgi:ABC-type thiamine transport system substrate-binding protein
MHWLLLLLFFLQFSCGRSAHPPEQSSGDSADKILRLFALDDFRNSGLEGTLLADFEQEFKCRVDVRLFPDPAALILGLKTSGDSVDVVFGIPFVFAQSDTLEQYLQPYSPQAVEDLNRDSVQDKSYRLIPYGFSYLGLLYNSEVLKDPPSSFGELQDDKFLNQMALVDPSHSGSGRAMLHLSLALFGNEGFEQMLRALRKNVFRSYENSALALASVNSGESSMMPGLITISAWQNELQHEESKLDFKLFSEGSLLYSECMGISTQSPDSALGGAFMDFVLRDSSQKMVIYKLGLFPANRKTLLPPSFSRVPINPWLVNNKLSGQMIQEHTSRWLQSWARIFGMY